VLHCGTGERSRYSDLLRVGRSEDRIPVGARFSAPFQTGPGAHPASYTKGTGSFPGVKRTWCGTDHPPRSSAVVKERVQLYIHYLSGFSWPVLEWNLTLLFQTKCGLLSPDSKLLTLIIVMELVLFNKHERHCTGVVHKRCMQDWHAYIALCCVKTNIAIIQVLRRAHKVANSDY
jgi:hypothetical protein